MDMSVIMQKCIKNIYKSLMKKLVSQKWGRESDILLHRYTESKNMYMTIIQAP